jgi:hypothetical protein
VLNELLSKRVDLPTKASVRVVEHLPGSEPLTVLRPPIRAKTSATS